MQFVPLLLASKKLSGLVWYHYDIATPEIAGQNWSNNHPADLGPSGAVGIGRRSINSASLWRPGAQPSALRFNNDS